MTKTQDDVNKLLQMVEKQVSEYNVLMSEVMERWGVQNSVDALDNLFKNPPMGVEDFVSAWFKMLNFNLESAIWLCVYHRMRLTKTQKEAMKDADNALSSYTKGAKNAL